MQHFADYNVEHLTKKKKKKIDTIFNNTLTQLYFEKFQLVVATL